MFISDTSDVQMFGKRTKLGVLNYSGDVNRKLVWYSDQEDFFTRQMACCSDARCHGSLVFGPP